MFLQNLIPNAQIATNSHDSDWRRADVKRSLHKRGEQLINVLHQNRSNEKVNRTIPGIFRLLLLSIMLLSSTFLQLGNLYLDQGKMKEAKDMYLRVLARKEKAWGPEHM